MDLAYTILPVVQTLKTSLFSLADGMMLELMT